MSDYTPSVDEARERFIDGFPIDTWVVARESLGAGFERMITQVKAETWDEAIQAVFDWWSTPEDERGVIVNPYGVHPADRLMQEIEKEAGQ